MWSRLIEIFDVGMQDTMELLLMEDQHMIQALSPNTSQTAFTNGIGTRGVIRRFEHLDACAGYLGHPFKNPGFSAE